MVGVEFVSDISSDSAFDTIEIQIENNEFEPSNDNLPTEEEVFGQTGEFKFVQDQITPREADETQAFAPDMQRLKGRYRWGGIFQVDPAFRTKSRYCDKQGYLIDERNRRIVNEEMKEKVYARRLKRYKVMCVPREDETFAQDWQGKRVNGHYDHAGRFIVDLAERQAHKRCDKDGFLLDAFKNVMVNLKMKLRFKMRNKCKSKLKWPFGGNESN